MLPQSRLRPPTTPVRLSSPAHLRPLTLLRVDFLVMLLAMIFSLEAVRARAPAPFILAIE